uniref:Cysteine protease n=1 Tax=Callorhinchus milii TaxID=7868 RepID=A0A4W3I177_CALMI
EEGRVCVGAVAVPLIPSPPQSPPHTCLHTLTPHSHTCSHTVLSLLFADDSLIYLDPHCCQPFVDVTHSDFPIQSFHCSSPKKMPFSKMDPSCTIGFYCGSNTERCDIDPLSPLQVLNSPASPDKYPLFSFSPGHAHEQQVAALGTWGLDSGPQSPVPQQHSGSQEFVFL